MACRWIIAIMIFTSTCVNYMMRVNLSVNLVAMVPVGISNSTQAVSSTVLNWTPYQRAYILSGYFWGYIVANVFGGPPATELWGPRRVVFFTTVICAILTLFSPSAAKHSFGMMLATRIALGFFGGFLFPATYTLIGSWAVPNERGKFIGALVGGSIGTFLTWTACGLLIELYGWEWGFYIFGILALIWAIVWWFLVYDSPLVHPRISESEKKYICSGIKIAKKEKISPPIRQIFTSIPAISLFLINFGTGWGIYFIITAAPNYLANALGFGISSTGLLSGVIYLTRSSCSFLFAYLGDIMLKRGFISVRMLRKVGCLLSHMLPGLFLLGMTIPGYSAILYLTIIIISMTMNGFVTVSSAANAYDITRNYISTISGFNTAFVTFAGIVSPMVTAYFTKYNEIHVEAWQPVFYLASTVYVGAGLQFIIFGSTDTQPWDEVKSQEQTDVILGSLK